MIIRNETSQDYAAVHKINSDAFDTEAEAALVEGLRSNAEPIISLVCEDEGELVGHILFTPVSLEGHPDCPIMGLAPMSVTPRRQGEGIGSDLVHAGLDQCRQLSYGAVMVLGHPGYYPRFGFVPASRFCIRSRYDAPEEAFMALELEAGFLEEVEGTVRYHAAFDAL